MPLNIVFLNKLFLNFKLVYLGYILSKFQIVQITALTQRMPQQSLKNKWGSGSYYTAITRYMKLQNILMTGCRDMEKNLKNTSKMRFSPICDP